MQSEQRERKLHRSLNAHLARIDTGVAAPPESLCVVVLKAVAQVGQPVLLQVAAAICGLERQGLLLRLESCLVGSEDLAGDVHESWHVALEGRILGILGGYERCGLV